MNVIEVEALKELAQLQASDIGISEENVKQKFLVPLLEALGQLSKNSERGVCELTEQGRRKALRA